MLLSDDYLPRYDCGSQLKAVHRKNTIRAYKSY